MKILCIVLFLFSVLIAAFSQILLKKGTKYKNIYFNRYTIIGYAIMVISTLLTLFSYRYLELSFGQILQSFSFVFVAILSNIILKEKISHKKIIGIIIIVCGAIIFYI